MKKLIFVMLLLPAIIAIAQTKKTKAKMQADTDVADSLYNHQQFASAIPVYERLVKLPQFKSDPQAWNRLGTCYYNQNEYEKSAKAFEEVYKLSPRFSLIFINRARCYSYLNEITSSIQMIDSASQRLGFGNYKLLESDPAFENLRKSELYKALYERVYATAYPCLNLPGARQFDFWLGDWDVYQTANLSVKTGFNRITRMSGGCVIHESWESVGAHNGVSINYYNPTDSTWTQKWAGSGQDFQEFYEGRYKDNALQFKWDVPNGDGTFSPGRLTFTNVEPGKVRQHSEQSRDAGKTWQTVYDFTYIRRN